MNIGELADFWFRNPPGWRAKHASMCSVSSATEWYTGLPRCLASSKGGMDWAASHRSSVSYVTDRPSALLVRPPGQRLWSALPKPTLLFGLGNRVIWSPQRINGSRQVAINLEMGNKKLAFMANSALRLFFSPFLLIVFVFHYGNGSWPVFRYVHCIYA